VTALPCMLLPSLQCLAYQMVSTSCSRLQLFGFHQYHDARVNCLLLQPDSCCSWVSSVRLSRLCWH
jgi:hypothetical protein